MDEMEAYRAGVEHRVGNRRRKNERRQWTPERSSVDWGFWICAAILTGFGAFMLSIYN